MASQRAKDRIGAAIGALAFLLTFGAVGAGALYVIGATLRDGLRAQDWVRVKAQVQHVDAGSVTYVYEWQGKKYAGDRAGTFVLGGNSDVDDWDDRMEAAIVAAQEGSKPLMVFVNPANPAESMVNNEIRWRLLAICLPFALGFGGGGLAAFYFIGRNALPRAKPGSWRARRASRGPLLKAKTREALTQWAVAIVWNGAVFPIAFVAIPHLWASGEWFPILLLSLFPLIGILILWGALSNTVGAFREGLFNTARA